MIQVDEARWNKLLLALTQFRDSIDFNKSQIRTATGGYDGGGFPINHPNQLPPALRDLYDLALELPRDKKPSHHVDGRSISDKEPNATRTEVHGGESYKRTYRHEIPRGSIPGPEEYPGTDFDPEIVAREKLHQIAPLPHDEPLYHSLPTIQHEEGCPALYGQACQCNAKSLK